MEDEPDTLKVKFWGTPSFHFIPIPKETPFFSLPESAVYEYPIPTVSPEVVELVSRSLLAEADIDPLRPLLLSDTVLI